jgi:hypothetical protein
MKRTLLCLMIISSNDDHVVAEIYIVPHGKVLYQVRIPNRILLQPLLLLQVVRGVHFRVTNRAWNLLILRVKRFAEIIRSTREQSQIDDEAGI